MFSLFNESNQINLELRTSTGSGNSMFDDMVSARIVSDNADRFIETLRDPKVWVMALFAAIAYVHKKLQ